VQKDLDLKVFRRDRVTRLALLHLGRNRRPGVVNDGDPEAPGELVADVGVTGGGLAPTKVLSKECAADGSP
jgi:hypothetical protein